MTRATLVRHDPWGGQPRGFNRQAAEVIYKAMAAMDEGESQLFGNIVLAACNNFDYWHNYVELAKAAEAGAADRADRLRRYYSRQAVAKQRRGEDNTHEIACLVEIGKAFDWSFGQRSKYSQENASSRRRIQGRFAPEGPKEIVTHEGMPAKDQDAMKAAYGVPKANLQGKDLSHYQQAYQQVRDMLHPYSGAGMNPMLHLNIEHGDGTQVEHVVHVDKDGKMGAFHDQLKANSRVVGAGVTVQPSVTPASAMMMGLQGIGASQPGAAYNARGLAGVTASKPGQAFHTFAAEEGAEYAPGSNEPYSATSRAFGHLQHGTKLLQEGLGPNAPLKLQYALEVANHVGQFGPEAQKVIGPIADRTAYRYRGTERTPDRALLDAFGAVKRTSRDQSHNGVRRTATEGSMIRGATITRTEGGHIRGTDPEKREIGWDPGQVLNYFREHLPNPDLNELQRRSGVIPPSEGVVITREGALQHQSVGYADDWYLPFNLKHLASLKGGDYIRTRTFGGPTTEDLYTGLISGARKLTVVSHNGVYNVEFDRNLRGGRRFNDKAARMVGRYGQLLDALRSGKVGRGDISGSRRAEIRDQVGRETRMPPDSEEFKDEVRRRVQGERVDPILSREERGETAREWMDQLGMRYDDGNKGWSTPEELTSRAATSMAAKLALNDTMGGQRIQGGPEHYKALAAERLIVPGDDEASIRNIVAELPNSERNLKGLDLALDKARQANIQRVHPLALNGSGYDDALHALQEQFPYYIASVKFQPWADAFGLEPSAKSHKNTPDTGYVQPRHNRPEKAEAGYFSMDVFGEVGDTHSGKVSAQTIRYQNRRVHGGAKAPKHAVARPVAGGAAAAGAGAGAAAPAAGGARAASPTAQRAAEQARYAADMNMLDHLRDQENFADGAVVTADNQAAIQVSNTPIRAAIADQYFPVGGHYAGFKTFFETPKETHAANLANPATAPATRALMDHVLALATGPNPPVAVDPGIKQEYLGGGRGAAAKELPKALPLRMMELHEDHNFPGADAIAYDAAQQPTPEHIANVYRTDPVIAPLIGAGWLPKEVDDPNFVTQRGTAEKSLRTMHGKYLQDYRSGNVGPDDEKMVLDTAEGFMRGTQLNRLHDRAKRAAPAPAPTQRLPQPNVTVVVQDKIDPNDPDALAPYLQQAGQMYRQNVVDADDDANPSRRRIGP